MALATNSVSNPKAIRGFPTTATGSLPAAAVGNAGYRCFVSDSSVAASGNFGAIVAGGGTNYVPVYSDGSHWRIG